MLFQEWALRILSEELRKKADTASIIEAVRRIDGQVAFYPCSRYCRMLLKEIRSAAPTLTEKILGCFDRSPHATSEPGIRTYPLSRLDEFAGRIKLLVIASSTYHSRQERDIHAHTHYGGPLLKTSYFDFSMPRRDPQEMLSEIERITRKLADPKSRMVYLASWMSRVLNDEDLTSLFESENPIPELSDDVLRYKEYTIRGINDNELKKELFADVYRMRHVSPAPGDVLLDIGAFRGETAIVFADMLQRKGKIYAFEPIASSYEIMKKNVSDNGLDGMIEPVNMGCSSRTRKSSAVSTDSGAPWNFISDADEGVSVQLTTVDDFAASRKLDRMDFIKMDVEGFESDVIEGAKESLKRYRPKLAVALYHKTSDMTSLPDQILGIVPDYKLFVRSNMDGPYGLTLFCI